MGAGIGLRRGYVVVEDAGLDEARVVWWTWPEGEVSSRDGGVDGGE